MSNRNRTYKANPLMPKIGSRAHRVLVELARHEEPLDEKKLMAAHGLDDVEPTIWRQGPYKMLTTSNLVMQDSRGWQLTEIGRSLMDEVEAEMLGSAGEPKLGYEVGSLATPRTVPPFKPLSNRPRIPLTREGALDYRDIPSRHTSADTTKDPS